MKLKLFYFLGKIKLIKEKEQELQNENLPKDMGKKIAQALKEDAIQEEVDMLNEQEGADLSEFIDYHETNDDSETGSFDFGTSEDSDLESDFEDSEEDENADYNPVFSVNEEEEKENLADMKLSIESDEDDSAEEFEMPNNINVLKKLIGQLPTGVPRQTGALIIRQTIEAIGIPMKSVLQDAQRVRDCLNSSIKDCSYTIQEYKTNIRNLEKQSQNYQKQLNKLNDIIGLFVYGEKK